MTRIEEIRAAIDPFWQATGSLPLGPLEPIGPQPEDRSAFATSLAASASTGAVLAAVAELTGEPAAPIDESLALAGFTTHTTVDGEPLPKWGSLSGLYRTADERFVQLHCNFPHHAEGAARRLGVAQERPAFEAAILNWGAEDLEAALIGDGMIGAAYRTMEQWNDHSHAHAVANLPVATTTMLAPGRPNETRSSPDRPLHGVKVVDCSRVLAGPVAGSVLANLGADVIRVGAAHLPHVEICVIATGPGKRNVFLDLRTENDRTQFVTLLRDADVVVDAFRPGALEQYGFGPDEIAAISPTTSVVQVSAFDWVGPWAGRRGFDSIVQTTTGIAMTGAEMADSESPVHLPVQALDYATGLFAAAAAIRSIHRGRTVGGSVGTKLSLIRTRNWLVGLSAPKSFTPGTVIPAPDQLQSIDSDFGEVELVRPFAGSWPWGPKLLGSSEPSWA